jgi:S-DNA-T family DNA segregation ATPase FtsK/SpoIIIE
MLYLSARYIQTKKLQGPFASDDEIKRVVSYLKDKEEPEYIGRQVVENRRPVWRRAAADGDDADRLILMLNEAKRSKSSGQEKLRLRCFNAGCGLAMPGRLRFWIFLEQQGVIGPGDGAKPRAKY